MLLLIGIDDTNNTSIADTAVLAQRLGLKIEELHAGRMVCVTCHQLLKNPGIQSTSGNQSVCLLVDADREAQREIELICRGFLMHECAAGSNAGFALASWGAVTPAITAWGLQAKTNILDRRDAMTIARENKVSIAGFTGTGQGVIGALAAVGLYYDGNDGRYLWMPGLRDIIGTHTYAELIDICALDRVENMRGRRPLPADKIHVDGSAYPILRDGKSLLLIEPSRKDETWEWNTISAEKLDHLAS